MTGGPARLRADARLLIRAAAALSRQEGRRFHLGTILRRTAAGWQDQAGKEEEGAKHGANPTGADDRELL